MTRLARYTRKRGHSGRAWTAASAASASAPALSASMRAPPSALWRMSPAPPPGAVLSSHSAPYAARMMSSMRTSFPPDMGPSMMGEVCVAPLYTRHTSLSPPPASTPSSASASFVHWSLGTLASALPCSKAIFGRSLASTLPSRTSAQGQFARRSPSMMRASSLGCRPCSWKWRTSSSSSEYGPLTPTNARSARGRHAARPAACSSSSATASDNCGAPPSLSATAARGEEPEEALRTWETSARWRSARTRMAWRHTDSALRCAPALCPTSTTREGSAPSACALRSAQLTAAVTSSSMALTLPIGKFL
mmetsp:Transcript_5561/g.21945  ORF Transcript_5561/g.21945 Transcript_5561/m.21945 type:complete len:307 (+) Transcript_5561:70-990(+)